MTGALSSSCGGCTACCTVMAVAMEPPKPAYSPCRHCTKGGCSIYADRPDVCRDWSCVWLLSQAQPALAMSGSLRPDRSGVVIELNSAGNLVAHCSTPAAWKRDAINRFLVKRARQTRVLIDTGEEVYLLRADGETERLRRIGVDATTNERKYVRDRQLGS